ncbi:MAG TPA: dihydrofolate reductase family protein [Puia sp.]|uniref:dihydrofolate reductase family protein n=1 Tax=Puia sp. TaxID=2045100 RepID=UPI002BAD6B19|nr:dihydrofolate reductase family protein [Puia sp.]HVU98407.1 dihydrofolate reductase family protein [Puia sp.]
MRKLVASAWMTLDGVFDASLMPQWFFPFDSKSRQAAIRDSVMGSDVLLMGRVTYEMLMPYWSALADGEMDGVAGKLNHSPKYVVSAGLGSAAWAHTTIIREKVEETVSRLKEEGNGEIRIEGSGRLANSLMRAGLVDEVRLLVHPFVMGGGKRYFEEGLPGMGLRMERCEPLEHGVLRLVYTVGS